MGLLVRYAGFRWMWSGQLLSQLGNAVFYVMGLWEIQLKSPFLLSIAGIAMTVPGLMGMVGGVFVDRYDPRRIMLLTDILRGLAVVLGLVALVHPAFLVWVVIVLLGINQLGNAAFSPAETVLLPMIVRDEDLTAANGLYSLTSQLASAVGSAIGGAAVAAIGIRIVFGMDAASFWLSALAILLMMKSVTWKGPASDAPQTNPDNAENASSSSFLSSFREGLAGFRRVPILVRLLPAVILTNFSYAAAFTMMPYWIHHHLHAGVSWYGLVDAAWAGGLVLGGLASGYFGKWPLQRSLVVGGLVLAAFTTGFALAGTPPLAAGLLLMAGLANGVVNAVVFTFLQRIIPSEIRGRVFGLIFALFGIAMPLGSLAAGVFLHVLPLWWAWALSIAAEILLSAQCLRENEAFREMEGAQNPSAMSV